MMTSRNLSAALPWTMLLLLVLAILEWLAALLAGGAVFMQIVAGKLAFGFVRLFFFGAFSAFGLWHLHVLLGSMLST